MEEMLTESRIAEDKAKKAMIDAARIADELRAEKENDRQTKLAGKLVVKCARKILMEKSENIEE